MAELTVFAFDSAAVRVIQIDGEPWFVGKDVAEVLGYARPNDALQQHCKGAVKRRPLQTPGGMQEIRLINEPDMLRLIVGSKLPAAERFERWVFEEVLPSIRKTGRYSMPAQAPQPPAPHLDRALRSLINRRAYELACELQGELRQRLTQLALLPLQPGENPHFPHGARARRITNSQLEDAKRWLEPGSSGVPSL